MERTEPRFGPPPINRPPIDRPPIGPIKPIPDPFPTHSESSNWAGSVALPRGYAISVVSGRWTVPAVIEPDAPFGEQPGQGTAICATWVGIDGFNELTPWATDVLQVGTTQIVDTKPFAWWEWAAAGSTMIDR
jgi:Peptidase A4 family